MTKAQVGDLIRITNVPEDWAYPNGAIYEVHGISPAGTNGHLKDAVKFTTPQLDKDTNYYAYDDQYEIFRKAGEEDSDADFIATMHAGETVLTAKQADELADYLTQDAINHPNHYTQGKFETIEVIEHLTSKYDDGFVAHCVGTAFKYMDRAPYKHDTPTECLRKAAKYLEFAIEHLDAESTRQTTK